MGRPRTRKSVEAMKNAEATKRVVAGRGDLVQHPKKRRLSIDQQADAAASDAEGDQQAGAAVSRAEGDQQAGAAVSARDGSGAGKRTHPSVIDVWESESELVDYDWSEEEKEGGTPMSPGTPFHPEELRVYAAGNTPPSRVLAQGATKVVAPGGTNKGEAANVTVSAVGSATSECAVASNDMEEGEEYDIEAPLHIAAAEKRK